MNQEQVTAENTEEKAAEVTASSEMAGQTQEAVRPKTTCCWPVSRCFMRL